MSWYSASVLLYISGFVSFGANEMVFLSDKGIALCSRIETTLMESDSEERFHFPDESIIKKAKLSV
jgi:hypothetical protein